MGIVFRTPKKNKPQKLPKKTRAPDKELIKRIFGQNQPTQAKEAE